MPRMQHLIASLTAVLASFAVDGKIAQSCDRCRDQGPCNKVCRLECETKKVEVTCWGIKCEEFCMFGPSKSVCKHCETVCEFCEEDSDAISSGPKKFVWREWNPCSAKIFTRKKLMKRTVTKTVPSYKWVIEDLCETCEQNLPEVMIEPGANVPPPPLPMPVPVLTPAPTPAPSK